MKTLQKLFFSFVIISFLIPVSVRAQNLEQELSALINSGDYLSLVRRYETAKDSVELDVIRLLSEGFIHSAFNRSKEASDTFLDLVTNYQADLGFSGTTSMMLMMTESKRYMGNYLESASIIQSFLDQTAKFEGMDSLTRATLKNQVGLGAFGDSFKPELVRPQRDCEISLLSGEGVGEGLLHIPVTINGKETRFVFDTGADGFATNFVTERFAIEHGIRILNDSVKLAGMVASAYAKMGVLDSMQIGNIVYKNVAFMIAPASDPLGGRIDAVLGSVFMRAVGEIQIYSKEKKIVFPIKESPDPAYAPNVIFFNGQPFLEAYVNNERLLLHFDTGGGVLLNSKYYEKHKETIESQGRLRKEGGIGGFGGLREIPQYYMPKMNLRVGDMSKEIKEVMVLTKAIDNNNVWIGGAVGSDFVKLYNKVTINFNKMFIAVE